MVQVLAGIRHGARSLRRGPGFAALAVTILASGIGATSVMYALVHGVLLRELPFSNPHELVWVYNLRTERDRAPLSLPDLEDYRREASTFGGFAAFTNWTANLAGAGDAERLDGVRVSGHFFDLLGTHAWVGRLLQPQDERDAGRVVVLTHGLWLRRFGGDSAIVGREISLSGTGYTVVGVLPPRFLFPFRDAELAVPLSLQTDPRRSDRGANFLRVVARLAPGATLDAAKAEMNAIAQRLQKLYPEPNARKTGISLYPLSTEIVRDYGGMLWMLMGSVAVLLCVGCVNLANLLLVRAAGRRTEFAVRASLGASRRQLAGQLLGESASLALVGGALGVVLADVGLSAWRAWGPADFPQLIAIGLDANVIAFAAVLSAATAIACGVGPAWFASCGTSFAVRDAARTASASRAQRTLQRWLITAQMSATTVLLAGMVVMARGLGRLEQVSPGFTAGDAVSVQLSLPPASYATRDALVQFFEAVSDRLHAKPVIESAGIVSLLPLSGLLSTADVAFPDRPAPPPDEVPQAHLRVASAEYFAAAGIAILEGRAFDRRDRQEGRPVAIVSRTFATRHWPHESAIGRSLTIVQAIHSPQLDVVGVVSDVKQFGPDAPSTADIYVPIHQAPAFQLPLLAARMNWVIRGHGDAVTMMQLVRSAVSQVDPGVAVSTARTLDGLWQASLGSRRANVRVLEVFGNVAAALCAIGVYGVAAYATRSRRRELAIRAALGAGQRDLVRTMFSGEWRAVATGLALGVAIAFVWAPALFGDAFEVNPRELTTLGGVAVFLGIVAGAAIYLPVRAAGSTSPAEALKG